MVKADAYGIGAVRVMRALEPMDPWAFGVATVDEGRVLREAGCSRRVVVFSTCMATDLSLLADEDLDPVLAGEGGLRSLEESAEHDVGPLPVHVEVDTGMGRLGFPASAVEEWAVRLRRLVSADAIRIVSTFTHFHSAEDDDAATREQWHLFGDAVAEMRRHGVDVGLLHAANSAAAFGHPDTLADLVRPGIFLYGGGAGEPAPEPVVRVRARVLEVRDVPSGTTVSYGATYRTTDPTRLVTLAIGYGDGVRRELSNLGAVLLRGRRAPVRGRVCMDTTVVEIGRDVPVSPGDAATLLGRDGDEEITLSEIAEWCDTIDYEILTGWSSRLPRVATGVDDEQVAPPGPVADPSVRRERARD